MSGLSTYSEEILLDALLALAPTFIALFTDDPTDANTGTEVAAASYIRKAITLVRTDSSLNNTNSVSFDESTEAWGTVTHCAIFDSETGGNQIINETLVNTKSIGVGETMTFPIGSLPFTLD